MKERDYFKVKEPIVLFQSWLNKALTLGLKQPRAMTLSTSSRKGRPTSRIVLVKEISKKGLVFYTNEKSAKGRNIKENPWGSILFYWDALECQIHMTGKIEKISRKKSEFYWKSRKRESQISQWISKQSSFVKDKETLEKKYKEALKKWKGKRVPCPLDWGGYFFTPSTFEFWISRPHRLHDRYFYKMINNSWICHRLYP